MPMEQDSPKRPMSPILLQPGIKDMPLADSKDFPCSEDWYVPCSHARVPSSAHLQTYMLVC
jgi:hypothetical protein